MSLEPTDHDHGDAMIPTRPDAHVCHPEVNAPITVTYWTCPACGARYWGLRQIPVVWFGQLTTYLAEEWRRDPSDVTL